MEPVTLLAALMTAQTAPVITEVAANPLDESSGEFVEIHNPGPDTLFLDGYSLTDGDALDPIEAWDEASHGSFPHPEAVTGTDRLPPGGYCLVFELDYASNPVYEIAEGTLVMTTADLAVCNGLAASSDPLTLFDPFGTADSNSVSTYGTPMPSDEWTDRDDDGLDGIPFDPGDGFTVERWPITAPDQEGSWLVGPAGGTPGLPPQAPPDTVNVACCGVWTEPEHPESGQPFTVRAAFQCWGTVSPSSGELEIFLDSQGDSLAQADELLASWPAPAMAPGETDTFAVSTELESGWYIPSALSSVPEDQFSLDDYARIPLRVGEGVSAVITEVVANAENEDTDELVEIYYPGPGSLLLPECHLTDGDALDVIKAWDQGTLADPDALTLPALPADRVALVLDSEYAAGTQPYDLPESTVVVTTGNTTLGNGLTTNDPVLLYHHADSSLASLMSTYGTPTLSDDPLECDDDGGDNIPFDPGDGQGVQRTGTLLPDVEWAWESSGPGGTPGWLPQPPDSQDLALVSLSANPADPDPGEQVELSALVINAGLLEMSGGQVTLFLDQNADSIPQADEILAVPALPDLAPGDTASVSHATELTQGNYLAAALVSHPEDGCPQNDLRRRSLVVGQGCPLVISEVLCNPESEDHDELIELYFPGPGVFDLEGCRLTDGDALDSLVCLEEGSLADPDAVYGSYMTAGDFAIVFDSEYPLGTQPYDLPPGALALTTANTTLGDGLSGNDPVTLYGPGGIGPEDVMSTYGTPIDGSTPDERDDDGADGIPFDPGQGNSVQRVDLCGDDCEDNWLAFPDGPTPGDPPPEVVVGPDAAVAGLALEPPMGDGEQQVTLYATAANVGTEPLASGELLLCFYHDANGDSLPEPGEMICSYGGGGLEPGDSLVVPAQWDGCQGPASLLALAECAVDSNPANDTARVVWNRPLAIVLNEVMYSPEPGLPEWVELHNSSEEAQTLDELLFADSRECVQVVEGPLSLPAGGYAVLCSDSSGFRDAWPGVEAPVIQPEEWPTLNNTNQQGESWADDLRLLLPGGQVLDWVP